MAQPDSDPLEERARQALSSSVAKMLDTTRFLPDTMTLRGTYGNELKTLLAQDTGALPAAPPAATLGASIPTGALAAIHSSSRLDPRENAAPAATDVGQTPHTGASTPTGSEPSELTAQLDQIAQQYRKIVAHGRARGFNVAADNLQRFLDGTGGTAVMGVPWLRGFDVVVNAEVINEGRFETSLNKIANGMRPGEKRVFDDKWDHMFTASSRTELYYASGTSTLTSRGTFELSMNEDTVSISGTVHHNWHDPYDWNPGAAVLILGSGVVSDNDALLLQKHRGARPFNMVADWDRSLSATIKVGLLTNTTTFKWTGP